MLLLEELLISADAKFIARQHDLTVVVQMLYSFFWCAACLLFNLRLTAKAGAGQTCV